MKMTNCAIVSLDRPFSHSKAINLGAARARGEYFISLNDDTEVIAPGWIDAMLQLAQSPGIGAVGAKLYYDDDTIQHAGITLNREGMPEHVCRGFPRSWRGRSFILAGNRNCLAVTGACLMTPKTVFVRLGGFSEDLKFYYNDVNCCLKAHMAGYRIVLAADAELFHYEAKSRFGVVKPRDVALFSRLGRHYSADPYYNANFDRNPPCYALKT